MTKVTTRKTTLNGVEVVIRANGGHTGLYFTLNDGVQRVKVSKHTTFVHPAQPSRSHCTFPFSWKVPEVILAMKKVTPVIQISEFGSYGITRIICDIKGSPLIPYFIPKGINHGEHARFSVPYGVTTVTIVDGFVAIRRISTEILHGVLTGTVYEVWSGLPQHLPRCFGIYRKAINAAVEADKASPRRDGPAYAK